MSFTTSFDLIMPNFAVCLQPSSVIPTYQPGLLESSPKMLILVELIDRSVQLGDKILIFRLVHPVYPVSRDYFAYDVIVSQHCSQSLSTLSYIEKLLSQRSIPIPNSNDPTGAVQYSSLKWTKNKNYCSKFNNKKSLPKSLSSN